MLVSELEWRRLLAGPEPRATRVARRCAYQKRTEQSLMQRSDCSGINPPIHIRDIIIYDTRHEIVEGDDKHVCGEI